MLNNSNLFASRAQITQDLLSTIMYDAFEDETKLDNVLLNISKETWEKAYSILKKLESQGKLNPKEKINIENHKELYRAVKEIERNNQRQLLDYYWMGHQVMTNSLINSGKKTFNETVNIFKPFITGVPSVLPQPLHMPDVQITDTYITENYLPIPWCSDGKIYSQRLYGHVSQFIQKLNFVLNEGIKNGKGYAWMEESWRKLTKSTAYDTARLLRTETAAMWSETTRDTYLSMGIQFVEIIGDAACGVICQEYLGDIVPLDNALLGSELPPYHPNCKCSYIAYYNNTDIETYNEELSIEEVLQ